MKSLLKLNAKDLADKCQVAKDINGGVSENLHDIELYLNENQDLLPSKGEVSIKELFHLVKKSQEDAERVQDILQEQMLYMKAFRDL